MLCCCVPCHCLGMLVIWYSIVLCHSVRQTFTYLLVSRVCLQCTQNGGTVYERVTDWLKCGGWIQWMHSVWMKHLKIVIYLCLQVQFEPQNFAKTTLIKLKSKREAQKHTSEMASTGDLWLQWFSCCFHQPQSPTRRRHHQQQQQKQRSKQPQQRIRIDRSMIGNPTNFVHTGHIGSADVELSSNHLNAIQNQMQSKGGYETNSLRMQQVRTPSKNSSSKKYRKRFGILIHFVSQYFFRRTFCPCLNDQFVCMCFFFYRHVEKIQKRQNIYAIRF